MRSLQKGTLRLAGSEYLPYDYAYYFVCPRPYLALPKVIGFRDWLRDAARGFPAPADWQNRRKSRRT